MVNSFAVFVLVCFLVGVLGALEDVYQEINAYYDQTRPPYHIRMQVMPRPVSANTYHSKRCALAEPGAAVRAFKPLPPVCPRIQAVLVSTPCLFSDSLGNWLSNYFESVLCARMAGLHYLAMAKVWEPTINDSAVPFLAALPALIPHSKPVPFTVASSAIDSICTCPTNCHERPNALWTKGRDTIKQLMWPALNAHYAALRNPSTVVLKSDLSNVAVGKVLPFVPDVAVHYRCGDNFVGHYGFLPFSAFSALIPHSAKTIYVLADKRGRKTDNKQHRAAKCDAIFTALFGYLVKQFPSASIVIRRGDDLYVDLLRLSSARTTICSVSSFCLWPAVVNNGTAYFPVTRLVGRGDSSLDLGFKWITKPKVVLGAPFEHLPTEKLVNVLMEM